MSGRISTIVRGTFIDRTDAALRNPTEELLQEVERMSPADLAKFSRERLGHPTDDWAVRHADDEFFGENPERASFPAKDGIPDAPGKREIHYAALIQALRVALYADPLNKRSKRNPALPIVTYWISGVPQYEIYVSLSSTNREVHMMILTPLPSGDQKPPALGRREENMWAVASKARIEELRGKIPTKYKPSPSFEFKGGHCQKLKSY